MNIDTLPLKLTLYDYQKTGVEYNVQNKRVLVGDQMGLGKTCQAIATVVATNTFPCIVVCPSSLRINWEREFHMWTDHKAMVLTDSIKNTWHHLYEIGYADVFIVNYESLSKYFVESIKKPRGEKLNLSHVLFKKTINLFKSIIVDESHRVKEPATRQSILTFGLAQGKEVRLLISGTPVQNKPEDLISQLAILGQLKSFGGMSGFKERFCGKYGDLYELQNILKQTCFYRREKSEVLKELPPKTRHVILSEITTQTEYNAALEDLKQYLKDYKQATDAEVKKAMRGFIMVRIGILKEIAARGKIKDVVEYVSDVVDSGEKIIIFSHLKDIQQTLKKFFPAAVTVFGDDDMQSRQNHIDRFQNDQKVQVIICSIKAAGVGITLTASSVVAHIELPWHPADSDQAEDRAHRKGQLKNVTCPYFIGKGTIDEEIYRLIQEKRAMSNAITGAKEDVEESVQNGLIDFLSKDL